jgi:hypothetical protein
MSRGGAAGPLGNIAQKAANQRDARMLLGAGSCCKFLPVWQRLSSSDPYLSQTTVPT